MGEQKGIQVGQQAPQFKLLSSQGREISLADFKGQKLILYFYPKDNTSGCTLEAQEFSKQLPNFVQCNCAVIGVSKDSMESHKKFIAKYGLEVILASDPMAQVAQEYGVWIEKSMYGKKYMGLERSTFLIDASGKVQRVWRKVKVNGHVEEVLNAAQDMK